MTAREFLENARRLNRLIESTKETLESVSDVHATAPTEGGRGGSRENSEQNKAIRRIEIADRLSEYMDYLWACREALIRVTTDHEISHISRVLIQQRYMLDKSWKEVADFLGYDCTYTKKDLNEEAINEVGKRKELWEGIKFPTKPH